MRIFYFVHVTGTDAGISGVPRVVKNLGRELAMRSDVELVPVSWSKSLRAIVHAEQRLLDNLARHGGPELHASALVHEPVEPGEGDWLLIAEAPHLQSHFVDYAPVLIDEPIGFARRTPVKVAVVVHDILPLTHVFGDQNKRLFADLAFQGDELQRLRFMTYAHSVALADLVLTVSKTTADHLARWLVEHGHDAAFLPPIVPIVLPEQVSGTSRVTPRVERRAEGDPIEFLSIGTVSTHKNQISAMAAFQRLVARRPELDIQFTIVGAIAGNLSVPASLLAKRAQGRIQLLGWLPDTQLRAITRRAHATVFVSLAEGYGLPIAESLWHGKPCLCSSQGSMAEIAQDGGCLTVDPGSLAEIEDGFERLATDEAFYGELIGEIAARRLKTWKRYAREIVQELVITSSGEGRVVAIEGDQTDSLDLGEPLPQAESAHDAVLMIPATDLTIPEAYSAPGRLRSIFYRSAIRYEQERDQGVEQNVLFFGPYVPLPAGRYAFWFDGEIDGELLLAFTANSGTLTVARTSLTRFDEPVSIDLDQAVQKFEIVGIKTPSLKGMVLRAIFAEIRRPEAALPENDHEALADPEPREDEHEIWADPTALPSVEASGFSDEFDEWILDEDSLEELNADGSAAPQAEEPLSAEASRLSEPLSERFDAVPTSPGRADRESAAHETALSDTPEAPERSLILPADTPPKPEPTRETLGRAMGEVRVFHQTGNLAFADGGEPLALPASIPAGTMRVHDEGLRTEGTIAFDVHRHGNSTDTILFFGPYLKLKPGVYHFRMAGELHGAVRLKITKDFSARTLTEVILTSFDKAVRVVVTDIAEKVEIVGERLPETRRLTLTAIGVSVGSIAPNDLAPERPRRDSGSRLIQRAANFLGIR